MTTPQQTTPARDRAQARRAALKAKVPQLITILKQGQYFHLYTLHTIKYIYLWLEFDTITDSNASQPRLAWVYCDEPKTGENQDPPEKIASVADMIYLSNITDIFVSQSNPVFDAHDVTRELLKHCLTLSTTSADPPISSVYPSTPKQIGYNIPEAIHLRAKDRLSLDILVIVMEVLLEDSGYQCDDTPTQQHNTANTAALSKQPHTASTPVPPPVYEEPERNPIFEKLTPKMVIKNLIEQNEAILKIDIIPLIELIFHRGIPITRCEINSGYNITQTKVFFYPDASKGIIYWGKYRQPVGMIKLNEISELFCGKNNDNLKANELAMYEPTTCITLTSSTPPVNNVLNSAPKKTTLIIVDGDLYDLNCLMFVIHRLLCDPLSSEKMRVKYNKSTSVQAQTTAVGATPEKSRTPAPASLSTPKIVKDGGSRRSKQPPSNPDANIPSVSLSITSPPEQASQKSGLLDDDDDMPKSIIKSDLPDHMGWLLDQFTKLSLDDQSAPVEKSKKNVTFNDNDDQVEAYITHIKRKTQQQRTTVRNTLERNRSEPNTSITGDSVLNLTLDSSTLGSSSSPREQMGSPMKTRLQEYTLTSAQTLDDTALFREQSHQQKTIYVQLIQSQQKQIDDLQAQLLAAQQQQEERFKRFQQEQEEKRQRQEREFLALTSSLSQSVQSESTPQHVPMDLSLSTSLPSITNPLISPPETPSKSTAEMHKLRESLHKAQSTQEKLRQKFSQLDNTNITPELSNGPSFTSLLADTELEPRDFDESELDKTMSMIFSSDVRITLAQFSPHKTLPKKAANINDPESATSSVEALDSLMDNSTGIYDISSLLIDTTRDTALQPSKNVESQLQTIQANRSQGLSSPIPSNTPSPLAGERYIAPRKLISDTTTATTKPAAPKLPTTNPAPRPATTTTPRTSAPASNTTTTISRGTAPAASTPRPATSATAKPSTAPRQSAPATTAAPPTTSGVQTRRQAAVSAAASVTKPAASTSTKPSVTVATAAAPTRVTTKVSAPAGSAAAPTRTATAASTRPTAPKK